MEDRFPLGSKLVFLYVVVEIHWRWNVRKTLGISIEAVLGERRAISYDSFVPQYSVDVELANFS